MADGLNYIFSNLKSSNLNQSSPPHLFLYPMDFLSPSQFFLFLFLFCWKFSLSRVFFLAFFFLARTPFPFVAGKAGEPGRKTKCRKKMKEKEIMLKFGISI